MVLPVNTELPIGTGSLPNGKQRLADGVGFIFVWGTVSYGDGFGNTRWLNYCHRYNCGAQKNRKGGIDATLGRYHHHHNDGN